MLTLTKILARLKSRKSISALTVATAMLVAGIAALGQPAPASAHCDSVNGPVVNAARKALDTGEVKWVLAYVQPSAEAELSAAFQQTLAVRKTGSEAQQLADHYFYETTVRLHRVGEGADYTGLKQETDYGPALESAEQALETNSLTEVHDLLNKSVADGLKSQYQAVIDARANAAQVGTVEALREQAEAELIFEKYVDALYKAALGNVAHSEGATMLPTTADAGHTH